MESYALRPLCLMDKPTLPPGHLTFDTELREAELTVMVP